MVWNMFVFGVRLGDVSDQWLGLCRVGDVEVDWPHMFPGSAVPFALGFYDVAAQCGSTFDDGHRDVLILNQRPKEHFLLWA